MFTAGEAVREEARVSTQAYGGRTGWVTFAAIVMFSVAFARIISAITYFDDSSDVANLTAGLFGDSLWAWGLWDLVIAALALLAGWSLLGNGGFGRVLAYVWAVVLIVNSFMIFGHNRIPIVGWLRGQASESQAHATQAGEHITSLGGHPSLKIGALLETHRHKIDDILQESLEAEKLGLALYEKLLEAVAGRSVMLEEYARNMISEEEQHLGEVIKMIRKPGEVGA